MVAKTQRLGRPAFDSLFKTGRRLHTPHVSFIFRLGGSFRCSVVVSKKVAKKAHDRNRIRRRLYDLLRTTQQTTAWQGQCIVVVKPSVASMGRRQFSEVLAKEIAEYMNSQ